MRNLAAVAMADRLSGEDAGPAPDGTFEQLWWIALPGMNWRGRSAWPPAPLANAICAAACTVRLIEITGQSRAPKLPQDSRKLREWLNDKTEGDDVGAFHRRVTLCLVMNIATSRTEPAHLVDYAKALLET
jgi:hypothetical protein